MLLRLHNMLTVEEGSTVIEYATLAPVLLLLIMGLIEYSLVMYASTVLEGAVDFGARLGGTGYINNTTSGLCPVASSGDTQTQVAYLNCVIGSRVTPLLNSSGLEISMTTYDSNYDNISNPTFTTCTNTVKTPQIPPLCSEDAGQANGVVVYTVSYPWQMVTPILQNILGSSGTVTLTASAVVRNEPYSTR